MGLPLLVNGAGQSALVCPGLWSALFRSAARTRICDKTTKYKKNMESMRKGVTIVTNIVFPTPKDYYDVQWLNRVQTGLFFVIRARFCTKH